MMERMWINQPSSLQPYHKYHEMNVLLDRKDSNGPTIYFLSGPIISQSIDILVLSTGWKDDSHS